MSRLHIIENQQRVQNYKLGRTLRLRLPRNVGGNPPVPINTSDVTDTPLNSELIQIYHQRDVICLEFGDDAVAGLFSPGLGGQRYYTLWVPPEVRGQNISLIKDGNASWCVITELL